MAKLEEITGKTRVFYSELGKITGKTRVLPCRLDLIDHNSVQSREIIVITL